jgi:hypothetical protein
VYRDVVSWIVIVYLIAFTVLSTLYALWSARTQVLQAVRAIFGRCLPLGQTQPEQVALLSETD